MPDYSRAIIYKIVSANAPNLVYYGSTIQTKEARLKKHVTDARPHTKGSCSSRHVINAGAYSIHKIQDAPSASLKELKAIERQFIEGRQCVNENVPGRTNKEYYLAIKEKRAVYNKANHEKQMAQQKARRQLYKAIKEIYNISPDLFH